MLEPWAENKLFQDKEWELIENVWEYVKGVSR